MEKARRRRRVPAFGEWNYYHYSDELPPTPAAAAVPFVESSCAAAPPELEACSNVWFKYSPPPRKPPPLRLNRKVRRPEKIGKSAYGGEPPRATPAARASDAVATSSSAARTPPKSTGTARAARVAQHVDADLYQVPPPDFDHDDHQTPRQQQQRHKKASTSRRLWMGCFGFSCIPAE